jgi:hypothetical protein
MGGRHLDGPCSRDSDDPSLAILEPLGLGLAVVVLVCYRAHPRYASASKAADREDDIDRLVHRNIPFAAVSLLGYRTRPSTRVLIGARSLSENKQRPATFVEG